MGWYHVRRKPSGKFEARWALPDGTVESKCFDYKEQARAYAVQRAKGVVDEHVGLAIVRKDAREALAEFLARSLDPKTTALNERRMGQFFGFAGKRLVHCTDITEPLINEFDNALRVAGSNPGGRHHVLKIVRAFCKFCLKKKWMPSSPFFPFGDFKLPKSTFHGRPLTYDEGQKMISIEPRYADVDLQINRAIRLGRAAILRISQVWKLTPEDFRVPDLLRVDGIKGQPSEWKELHPDAVAVLNEMLPETGPGVRFFAHWGSVEAMRNSIEDKARRVGLPGVRFHDACKVTRVTELADQGWSPAKIAHVSNTTAKTLVAHYIKADKKKSFAEYKTFVAADHAQTTDRPQNGSNTVKQGEQERTQSNIVTDENAATSPPIPAL